MGSLPRLRMKDNFRYRKGSTCQTANCQYCAYRTTIAIPGKGVEPRCKIFGVRESVRYRIRDDFRCDHQTLDYSLCDFLPSRRKEAQGEPEEPASSRNLAAPAGEDVQEA